ncbi:hypothetical protein Tco_0238240 [Tanacetum coccineum]
MVGSSGSNVVDSINNLDASNPLHVQNNENSNTALIPFKLLVKCSCDASKELGLHQQLMKLMQLLISLDNCYQPVRSSILTRDPFPEVKDAYNVISREESHRWVPETSSVVQGIENGAKTEIFRLDSIKFAHFSKSRRNPRKATSIPLDRARKNESNGPDLAQKLDLSLGPLVTPLFDRTPHPLHLISFSSPLPHGGFPLDGTPHHL